ncbi:o-glucosyltransferase rumi [Nesidiocoris tenuis]|nr:o-glucosyltransferase rumi [Nesidiocoris tenuis]
MPSSMGSVAENEPMCSTSQSTMESDCSANLHQAYTESSNEYIRAYLKAKNDYGNYSCSGYKCYLDVIKQDLKPFSQGIDKKMIELTIPKGVKYIIMDGRVYREKDCLFPSRCEGVDYFLNSIKEHIPNTQLVINFHDWPQVNKHFNQLLPVFSFSKTDEFFDIMYPAWSFWKGGPALSLYPKGIGRWDEFYEKLVQKSKIWTWNKKKNLGFFIGSRTSSERDHLILLSRGHPELVEAKYTKNQAWKSIKDTLNEPPSKEVPLEEHCHYKYLFNFRGVAASFRFKFLFLCKSVVVNVGNEWDEFFYRGLKPWYHYIPMNKDDSQEQYKSLLLFLIQEDEIAQEIANRGFDFIFNNLKMQDVKDYWKELLVQYTKLLKFKPKLDKDLVDVTTP